MKIDLTHGEDVRNKIWTQKKVFSNLYDNPGRKGILMRQDWQEVGSTFAESVVFRKGIYSYTKQSILKISGSKFPPGTIWQFLETFLLATTGLCSWHLVGRGKDAAKHATMFRIAPHNKVSRLALKSVMVMLRGQGRPSKCLPWMWFHPSIHSTGAHWVPTMFETLFWA